MKQPPVIAGGCCHSDLELAEFRDGVRHKSLDFQAETRGQRLDIPERESHGPAKSLRPVGLAPSGQLDQILLLQVAAHIGRMGTKDTVAASPLSQAMAMAVKLHMVTNRKDFSRKDLRAFPIESMVQV